MKKLITLITFTLFLLLPTQLLAQRGCCSWHGGVSGCGSNGRTICSDGTYSPSCTCGGGGGVYVAPSYSLPAPVNPTNGNQTYTVSSSNWCNYDVTATWLKPYSGDRYSIAMTKVAGGDPGPNVDTGDLSFTFKNITPGKWYVNLKTANAERWTGNTVYWTVELPKITPRLEAIVNPYSPTVTYDFSCLSKVEAPDFITQAMKLNNNSPTGTATIPLGGATEYVIKGTDTTGKKYEKTINYSPPPTTPVPTMSYDDSASNTAWVTLGGFGVLAVGYIYYKVVTRMK